MTVDGCICSQFLGVSCITDPPCPVHDLPKAKKGLIDHSTCGHLNHVTLDRNRHQAIHTALLGLITKWNTQANRQYDHRMVDAYQSCVKDLVQAIKPFEVEQ